MVILLISVVIGLFVAMLFVNVYFRIKVIKSYRRLVAKRVEFGAVHVFNMTRLQAEVLPKYPESRDDILTFVQNLRYSIRMATVLLFLITAFGAVLMYFRETAG